MPADRAHELADRVLTGDPRAVARALTAVEREDAAAATLVARLFAHTGRSRVVGLTGAPGVGKSTLADRMTAAWRRAGHRVAVLAVDPTSPFTGGAILGDRVRMQGHSGDAGVFVRSMATRGALGGLARATHDALVVLEAAGFELVLLETVGVGQGEVDVSRTADVSVVIIVPGSGDDVQAIKAGIMEIADVFVVNKADRDGADRAVADIEGMLSLREPAAREWRPPVVKTCAATGDGVEALLGAIDRCAARERAHATRVHERARARLEAVLAARVRGALLAVAGIDEAVDRVAARAVDPYTAADTLLAQVLKEPGPA